MRVLGLIELPTSIPLGMYLGQCGSQAVLDELNTSWRNSGSGVLFGQDVFGERFKAFSALVNAEANQIKDTVLKTVETICCPNKIQSIENEEDLRSVPVCMYVPILTMPAARALFESGQVEGWGVKAQDLPAEDVVGRLINNGRFDTADPNYDREACVTWTVQTGDPNYTIEELKDIETSRDYISQFIEDQMGPNGDGIDFTNLGRRMGKLKNID